MEAPVPQEDAMYGRILRPEDDYLTITHTEKGSTAQVRLEDVVTILCSPGSSSKQSGYILLHLESRQDAGTHKNLSYELKSTSLAGASDDILERFLIQEVPEHLVIGRKGTKSRELHVVISTRSGLYEAEDFFKIVKETLSKLDLPPDRYQVHRTSSEQSILDLARDRFCPCANEGRSQTILLLSGDGGVVDLVNAVLQGPQSDRFVKPSIGLLVLGTGNALANSSGLNEDNTKGLASFIRGAPRPVPTFVVTFSSGSHLVIDEGRRREKLPVDGKGTPTVYGAVVCSWGLHASLVADSDTSEYRRLGDERFQMVAKELIQPSDGSKSHIYKGRISLLKKDASGREDFRQLQQAENMYILATLVSNLERHFKISPKSKPLDGQLRLVHWGPLPGDEVKRILGLAFEGGKHVQDDAVGYEDIEGMRIDFDEPDGRWRRVCIDGKIIEVGRDGWMVVRRETRNVLDLIASPST